MQAGLFVACLSNELFREGCMSTIISSPPVDDSMRPLKAREWFWLCASFLASIALCALAVSTRGLFSVLPWFFIGITIIPMWIYAQNRKGRIVGIVFLAIFWGYIMFVGRNSIEAQFGRSPFILTMLIALCWWAYWFTLESAKVNADFLKRLISLEKIATQNQVPEPSPKSDLIKRQKKYKKLIRKKANEDCPRFEIQDMYTIAELVQRYEWENSKGRIRLLRRVYRQGYRLPYELALKAVTDSNPVVRGWIAREGYELDYRESQDPPIQVEKESAILGPKEETLTIADTVKYLHPDRNLIERIKQDSDPFVRAALYENHHLSPEFGISVWAGGGLGVFWSCNQIERLALMRNQDLSFRAVEKILDLGDLQDIETEERIALAKVCLVNANIVKKGRRSWEDRQDLETIWKLAAKWPARSKVPYYAFKYVQTNDEVKARIYRNCEEAVLRKTILDSCLPNDKETITLGRGDADAKVRFIAYSKSRSMQSQDIEDILRREQDGGDEWVVDGLLKNPWLGRIASELKQKIDNENFIRSREGSR
jgi:hypothetical protein